MLIINGVTYSNQAELAAAIATEPELRDLRDAILLAVVSTKESPVRYNVGWIYDELARVQELQRERGIGNV